MPIRTFEHLLHQHRNCQSTEGVQILSETRLGIEGSSWLRRVINANKEPVMTALGGSAAPLELKSHIVKELEWFKANQIQPIFVFPGILQTRKTSPFPTEDTRPSRRHIGWENYNKNQINSAKSNWSNNNVVVADLMTMVLETLDEHGMEFMRCPYGTFAQLSYMLNHPRQIIHAVWSTSDILMYDVDKVIVSMDFEKNAFSYIDKQALLASLQITDEQFLDICLLAGDPSIIPTFPPLNSEGTELSFSWATILNLIRTYGTAYNVAMNFAEHPSIAKSNYIDAFCRTRCSIKYHLVLAEDGRIEPLNRDTAPSDMHELMGTRLPDEIYYYLSVGLISPQVINNLIGGTLIEIAPLCNGETEEYRQHLQGLLNVRTQTLALLTQPLNQHFQTKKVHTSYYFSPNTEYPMHHSSATFNVSGRYKWHVTKEFIDEQMEIQKHRKIDLLFCLIATAKEGKAAKTVSSPKEDKGIVKVILKYVSPLKFRYPNMCKISCLFVIPFIFPWK